VKTRRILVPLDGSSGAEAALPKAVHLAREDADAKLYLMRAVDPATLPGGCGQVAAINQAAEYLRSVAVRLRAEGVEVVSRSVSYSAVGPAIVEASRTVKPAFIVMTTRGGNPVMPGGVAEFVLHRTRMPIVLVRERTAPMEHVAIRRVARVA
jgi:nucleotide-binding universal stress UspA family protein